MSNSAACIAFFDVDETLIATKSMFDFLRFLGETNSLIDAAAIVGEMQRLSRAGVDRSEINIAFWRNFTGLSQFDVRQLAEAWTVRKLDYKESFFIEASMSRLAAHKQSGHFIALVSGSSIDILAPIADVLKVDKVLATRLHVVDGRYTGEIDPPVMIGAGKREAALKLLSEMGADPAVCFAYGDHPSDLPLLEVVGHPVAIGAIGELADIAGRRGWTVLPGVETVRHSGEAA